MRGALRARAHGAALWLAQGLGAGRAPVAPGTAGTLAAVPLYLLLAELPPWAYLAAAAGVIALAVPVCGMAARRLGVHDHPSIVLDEVAGFLVAMAPAPAGWPWVAAGFVLFRLFDILKPPPVRAVDRRVGGGLGIVLDDVLAGLWAGLCLGLAARWLPVS